MEDIELSDRAKRSDEYERATRLVRIITIILVAATLPWNSPQTRYAVLACLGMAAFSGLRLLEPFKRMGALASPGVALVLDNLFIGLLLFAIGRVDTAYSGLFLLTLIAATYWYRLIGALVTLAGQLIMIIAVNMQTLVLPMTLDAERTTEIALTILMLTALLVERLTGREHDEQESLKRISNENRTERDRLTALINALHDGVVLVDDKGRVVLVNQALADLVGVESIQTGQDISKLLALRRPSGEVKLLDVMNASNQLQSHRDFSLVGSNGNETALEINITPVGNEKPHYILILKDITNEKSLDEQRQEFISVASHELRTPLSVTEAALSTMLLGKDLSADTIKLGEQAHRNVVFLASLVKELTALSEAQNEMIPMSIKPVNVRGLIDQLAKDYTPLAVTKGLKFEKTILPDIPAVLSNEHHIREILQNYITNAIKYTKNGTVSLKAEPIGKDRVLFSVADSGIGISAANQSKLFTKFFRAEDYRTRETGGSGLGLYLCLELARRINGRLWCRSRLNHGSIFYLEVPPFSHLPQDRSSVFNAQMSALVDQL